MHIALLVAASATQVHLCTAAPACASGTRFVAPLEEALPVVVAVGDAGELDLAEAVPLEMSGQGSAPMSTERAALVGVHADAIDASPRTETRSCSVASVESAPALLPKSPGADKCMPASMSTTRSGGALPICAVSPAATAETSALLDATAPDVAVAAPRRTLQSVESAPALLPKSPGVDKCMPASMSTTRSGGTVPICAVSPATAEPSASLHVTAPDVAVAAPRRTLRSVEYGMDKWKIARWFAEPTSLAYTLSLKGRYLESIGEDASAVWNELERISEDAQGGK